LGDDWGIYIPEVKYLSPEVKVNYKDLSLIDYPNVHFVGDALSARGITVSGAQAIYCSEYILREFKKEIEQLRRKRIGDKQKGKTKLGNSHGKPIIQLDPQGNFIQEWPSIRQAGFSLVGNQGESIRKCLKGMQKTAYGFAWKYKK